MRALSIRQPYAELILRGVKTVEYRSRPTRIIGDEFYIYAARGRGQSSEARGEGADATARRIWSDDLAVTDRAGGDAPPAWMLELAGLLILGRLPTGVLVGTAAIERCTRESGTYRWHLARVKRLGRPLKPARMPQPAWFRPF
jgi:hypothetical protein